jgi:hypothetical protein
MAIKNSVLTNTPLSIYTSVGTSVVTVMYFCNVGTKTAEFSLYIVPVGLSWTEDRAIYHSVQVTEKDTYVIDTEKIVLNNGDAVFARVNDPTGDPGIRVIVTVSSIEV